ncbi:MAG: PAS domain-containing sensor histidine kinase, partial [Cytophagales bacterium CG18_big_fil_WC_8_21_14_2_50_42_9]
MICTIDAAGRFIQVSASCRQVLGYNPEELKGCFTKDFIHPKDRSKTVEFFKYVSTGNTNTSFENCCIKKSKEEVSLSWSAVWSAEDKSFFCIERDATAQNAAAKEIHHRKELQQLLLAHGSDMMALLDENGNYLYVAGTSVKTLGYEPDQLIGVNALHLIHSEDVAQAQQALILIQQTREPVKLSDIRIKTVDGQWRWVEITVSNQLENPAIKAIFVSSQDITQRKRAQLQVTQSEQRFRSLFQNNPDLMLYQDEAGVILDANPAFLSFIKKPKEEVLNRPLYDFLPQEVVPIFKKKLEEAFAGSEVKFKADVNLKELGQKILSVVKVPLRIGHKVVGVHAVIKDITKIIQAQRTIEKQAQKLNAILESITDAFYTLDKNWNFTFINGECERVLQVNRQALLGKNLWSSFPPDITQQLYKPYQQAIETGETIHFEAYLNTYKSWFDIKVYPSEEGLSVYFQDVTQQVNSKEELEKLSLVARKITNGVVITDAQGLTEWVNEGFTHITGYTLSDIIGKKPGTILQGPETDPATIKRISNKIKTGKPFTDEILNYKKTGQQFWIHKEVTPILNERGEVIKFIAIQNDITERKKVAAEL